MGGGRSECEHSITIFLLVNYFINTDVILDMSIAESDIPRLVESFGSFAEKARDDHMAHSQPVNLLSTDIELDSITNNTALMLPR